MHLGLSCLGLERVFCSQLSHILPKKGAESQAAGKQPWTGSASSVALLCGLPSSGAFKIPIALCFSLLPLVPLLSAACLSSQIGLNLQAWILAILLRFHVALVLPELLCGPAVCAFPSLSLPSHCLSQSHWGEG